MMAILHANESDMSLQVKLPFSVCPSDIPLSYRIGGVEYRGLPDSFSPKTTRVPIDSNITRFSFSGESPDGVTVSAEALCYRDFPVVEWTAWFSNEKNANTPIVSDIRIVSHFAGKTPVLYHSNGDDLTENGYETFRTPITETIPLCSENGLPNYKAFPYMRLCFDDWFVNIALGWSGDWRASFSPEDGGVAFSVGQKRCHFTICPGETMRTPRVTLMAAGESEDNARNLWRKWYFAHILPKENGAGIPPKMCMHVVDVGGEEFTGATTEVQLEGLRNYINAGLKPDIWWMDAGWYRCDHKWYENVGTWECDRERFPNGMGEIGEFCEANGVRFLVWFEPERVRENTLVFRQHPEWLLRFGSSENYLFNLGDPAACKWMSDYINAKIDEYRIRVYRQDFNFEPLPYWLANETENRIGAMENLHVQGYLAYWDALIDRHPGLWIDSCAGGGRRNDLDTMRRAVTLHYTDIGYGNHPVKQKQHRLMFEWIPYFRAHNKNWDNPDGTYGQTDRDCDEFSFHNALAPALTNMLFYQDDEEHFRISRKMVPVWRRAAEIELRGDYYPLTECRKDARDWFAMQFDDPEKGDGFVQVIRNTLVEEDTFVFKMKAVKPGAAYRFENMETGEVMRIASDRLIAGIPLSLAPRSGQVWFYRAE